ncbi:hypothetical protein QJS10_CPB11g01587 [Acorus calamus]|uniref:Disease resistance protein At4g27190-like leucine-rich repeats domain-containing protein n=1 Tax=Acorus calamus TaxID=4465 RepID=A0AAV9DW39_ACOCL|nr:hypothetical protein QJS10_CPB11g01587 [Acorus calamus]
MPKLASNYAETLRRMSSLEVLFINSYDELASLPNEGFQLLTSLKTLGIDYCPKLSFSTMESSLGGLPSSLESFNLSSSPHIGGSFFTGMHSLVSLQLFSVSDCPMLTSFPKEGVKNLIHLQTLSISNCANLEALPTGLRGLSTLETFDIEYCPQITCLPEEKLPASLHRLSVNGCPELKERCCKEGGQDWPKIEHIPFVILDGEFEDLNEEKFAHFYSLGNANETNAGRKNLWIEGESRTTVSWVLGKGNLPWTAIRILKDIHHKLGYLAD